MRHGKAEKTFGKRDFDRELVDRGMRDSRAQARDVLATNPPERIIASSSIRTTQTAEHVQEELGLAADIIDYDEALYLCSVRELLVALNRLDDLWKAVCVIGHNPSMEYLSEYLTGKEIGHVHTSGIVKMTFDGRWKELSKDAAYLERYYSPK